MKKTIAVLILLITIQATVQAQIPNGSFENWTTMGSYSEPDGWDNFNALTAPNSVYTCEKGTAGAPHGSSFIMLVTRVVGTSTLPGLAVCGKYDIVTKKPKSGFPYTGRPLSLTGKWQYMAMGTDTGRIGVYLTKWNTVTGARELIASFEYDLPGMVMSWTSFSIPLTYQSTATPDTAVIGLVSSNKSHTAGSYLYVDSLNFSGTAVGVSALQYMKYSVTLFPNPAKDNLSIDFGAVVTNDVKLWVMDMYGRVVREAALQSGKRMYSMDVNTVSPGLYFVKVKVGGDIMTQRLVVQ